VVIALYITLASYPALVENYGFKILNPKLLFLGFLLKKIFFFFFFLNIIFSLFFRLKPAKYVFSTSTLLV